MKTPSPGKTEPENSVLKNVTFQVTDVQTSPYDEIRERLRLHTYVCVRGLFSSREVLEARQRLEKSFDRRNDRKHDPADAAALMGNYQKLFVGGTAGVNATPRFLRMFYNPLAAEDKFGFHDLFRRLVRFRNRLYELPEEFTLNGVENGYWSATRINHYPRGGGFMASHDDGVTAAVAQKMGLNQYFQVVLILSRQGVDFTTGGAFVEIDGKQVFYERECEPGDVMIYDGRTKHGVQEIDAMEPLDMETLRGRCAAFATLFKHFAGNSIADYRALESVP